MEFQGKKVLVVGAGRSGLAAAGFLAQKGAAVVLTDAGNPALPPEQSEALTAAGVELAFGGYPEVKPGSFALVVMSPGVPLTVEPVRSARQYGIPVTGELELAWQFTKAPVVAITGTNGKTTTTALTGAIFQKAGRSTLVGGNIGLPLITEVEKYDHDAVVVAEVSSFQLETISAFRPKVGVILNITPDHLDRHGDMENYIDAKARIMANQEPGDYTVLNGDDPLTAALGRLSRGEVIYFSRRRELPRGVFIHAGNIVAKLGREAETICRADELRIPGAHNLENALAAVAAARVLGVSQDVLAAALREFPGVSHRLEFVAEINGVKYVNDSKGTNPDAAIKALEAYEQPIVLLAGGRHKGSDLRPLAAKIKEKARVLVVLGESAGQIAAAARDVQFENILYAGDLPEAVMLAREAARPGDIVLLSPACASWDMFKNFEARGDLFKKVVLEMCDGA